jgi:hypothetical protein
MTESKRHPIKFRGLDEVVVSFRRKHGRIYASCLSNPPERRPERRSGAFSQLNLLTPLSVKTKPKSDNLMDFRRQRLILESGENKTRRSGVGNAGSSLIDVLPN